MSSSRLFITVIGSSRATPLELEAATLVGHLLAREGVGLVSGGRNGVMEAVARSHSEEGGLSIGILPDTDLSQANEYNSINIPSGVGFARNLTNILAGSGVITVGGSVGTLTELGYAIQFRRPVLLLTYVKGVSAIPPDFLYEIAPYADLTLVEDPEELPGTLKEWLEKITPATPRAMV